MGLGEKAMEGLFFPDGVYSMWALDTANPIEDGKVPGKNMYSTHPFYMFKTAASTWTGVFTNLAAA
jgi:alpha-glucosidase/lysosomal alpha-glucosidase